MPKSAALIKRQLELAKVKLAAVESNLNGMVPKKNPNWREANSHCKQLERRLEAHTAQRGSGSADNEEE